MSEPKPWVPCSESLPADGATVWFWRRLTNGEWGLGEGTFRMGMFYDLIPYPLSCVSHWMPRYVEPAPLPPGSEGT